MSFCEDEMCRNSAAVVGDPRCYVHRQLAEVQQQVADALRHYRGLRKPDDTRTAKEWFADLNAKHVLADDLAVDAEISRNKVEPSAEQRKWDLANTKADDWRYWTEDEAATESPHGTM